MRDQVYCFFANNVYITEPFGVWFILYWHNKARKDNEYCDILIWSPYLLESDVVRV